MKMKSKLFQTVLTGVIAAGMTFGAGAQLHAASLVQDQAVQDQDMQKPSPDPGPAPDQAPPPDQNPQYSAPQGQAPPPPPDPGLSPNRQYAPLSAEQLHQLVAPIALYPDALVAQILAASAYPTQIVEADRFLKENPNLRGQELGAQVDRQDWDPSVKALCQFPSVMANLDRDLSWTQELGDANYNQSADVMQAIQIMRHKAQDAGNLRTTPQQRVYDRDDQVQIDPVDPDTVYVPQYNPAYVYGYPVGVWPGFYPWWGFGGPYISFGFGFPIAPFFGFGWGWHGWGLGWGFHGGIFFGGHPYAFRGAGFYSRNAYFHGNARGYSSYGRGGYGARGFAGRDARGFSGNRGYAGRGYAGNRGAVGANRGYAGGNRGYANHGTAAAHNGGTSHSSAPHAAAPHGGSSSGGHSSGGGHSGGGGHSSGGGHGH
jgi:hypothetical protein